MGADDGIGKKGNVPDRLRAGLHEARVKDASHRRQMEEWGKKHSDVVRQFEEEVRPTLRPASKDDYEDWVWSYMQKGNEPTHYYNYPFERVKDSILKARGDFKMVPLFGAQAVNIIVPEGVKFLGGELGHCNLYFADGHVEGTGWVPVYEDMIPKR